MFRFLSLVFLLSLIGFNLGLSSCSSGNSPSSPSTPPPATTSNVLNAPVEDKRALLVMMQAAASSTGSVSQGSRKGGIPFISNAYAAPLACDGAGSKDFSISGGNTLVTHEEGSDLRLLFTDFTAEMTFDQCKMAPISGCSFPYILNGSYKGVLNGTVVKSNFRTGSSSTQYNNIRGHSSTNTECSGLTIDTSNDLGRARNMGLNITATLNGTQNSGESIMNLVQYSGTVCIDNVHYLVPSKEEWFQLQRQLCGGS